MKGASPVAPSAPRACGQRHACAAARAPRARTTRARAQHKFLRLLAGRSAYCEFRKLYSKLWGFHPTANAARQPGGSQSQPGVRSQPAVSMWNATGPSGPLWGHAAQLGANDRYKLKSVSDLMKIAEGPPDSVSAGARRRAVRTALDTCKVATDKCVEEPVLWEVAECDPDYEGEWDGTWELCTLVEDNGERCSVRIVSDGKLCKKVPRRFVRRKSLFPHLPRPLTQQLLDGHLGDVHDPRVLRTMAVLAEDLMLMEHHDPAFICPSEDMVFDMVITGMHHELRGLQLLLQGMEPEHWSLLAPLLRSRALIDPADFTADESGRARRDLLEQRSWWISLLLRALNAPVLLILKKQDALVLAKRLLVLVSARDPEQTARPWKRYDAESSGWIPNPSYYRAQAKRQLTALLGAMGRAHGFDEPTLAVLRALAFTTAPAEVSVDLLSRLCHVPPPCSPPLEPLTTDLPASSEVVGLLQDTLARLGTDALSLTLLPRMTLRAKRAAACSCRWLRTIIAPHLRSATLHVLAEDATLDNAAFVARLPTLERLHVEGESFLCDGLDIPKLRSLPRLALKTIGAPAALFLGCLLSGGEHTIRLSNGLSFISLQPVATRSELSLIVSSAADLAVILGSLSNNRALKRLTLPMIICEKRLGQPTDPDALTPCMAAVDGLGEMVVQLGQALHASVLIK